MYLIFGQMCFSFLSVTLDGLVSSADIVTGQKKHHHCIICEWNPLASSDSPALRLSPTTLVKDTVS